MPLSEHEQKLLEQLEKQLHEDDPKFASSMGSVPGRSWSTRHLVIGVLATLAGVLLLLVGVSMQNIFVGVLGFVVMGAGVYFATMRSSAVGQVQGSRRTQAGQAPEFVHEQPRAALGRTARGRVLNRSVTAP